MKTRILFGALAVATAAITSCGSALAQDDLVLKAADVHPAGYPTVVAIENLGKKLEGHQRPDQRADVSVDAARRREGDDRAGPGRRDPVLRASLGALGPVVDELNVFNMPFVFRDNAHMQQGDRRPDRRGAAGQDHATAARLVALGWMDGGARSL